MPSYDLQHGSAYGNTDCGNLVISNAGGSTTVTNIPQGGGPGINVSTWTYTAKAGGGGTIMNPVPGDMLNLGSYTVTIGTNTFSFSSNATYRAAVPGTPGGYFTAPGITAGLGDWDAADGGSGIE